ncbi:MAG: flavodoxin family protein [Dehalococcoidia bacterium]|nr:flavodoxin family protein [Dehalococcoidia bacterium]
MDFGDSDKLKVLAIAGSPRRKGNTDTLLEKAVEGARSNTDTEIIKIILSELCIAPCRHCDGCLHTGRCVIDDDMQSIHNLLRKADRIILASPIFFMSLGAQTRQ